MKQKFVVEIEWSDEQPASVEWFERIVHDGLSDNGFDESFEDDEGEVYGDYALLSVKDE